MHYYTLLEVDRMSQCSYAPRLCFATFHQAIKSDYLIKGNFEFIQINSSAEGWIQMKIQILTITCYEFANLEAKWVPDPPKKCTKNLQMP